MYVYLFIFTFHRSKLGYNNFFNFNFNLFSVHLIHEGYDPSDMELVNTEIRLQISYMK